MAWGKKKKEPAPKEPPRTPGRTSTHRHNYSILLNKVVSYQKGKGGPITTEYLACQCGMQTTRTY